MSDGGTSGSRLPDNDVAAVLVGKKNKAEEKKLDGARPPPARARLRSWPVGARWRAYGMSFSFLPHFSYEARVLDKSSLLWPVLHMLRMRAASLPTIGKVMGSA